MEGRTSLLWACSLLCSAGCISGGAQKIASAPNPAPAASNAPVTRSLDTSAKSDPKRTPRVLIAFAKFKEDEAKALEREPEQQFKVRDQARTLYQEAIKMDGVSIEAHR